MKRLSKKQMWIFAVGQLGWSILGGIIANWLVFFYQPTADNIAAGQTTFIKTGYVVGFLTVIGIITMACRIFDAVTDPLVASASDRSRNPKGRRLPFMQKAALPFAVITVLIFIPPVNNVSGINIAWVFITLVLYYLFMTIYCTPYNALISEFGKTPEDRMTISTLISFTYFLGTALAYATPVLAGIFSFAGFVWSYRFAIIVLAVIALVCMLVPTFLLNEKEFVDSAPLQQNVFKSLLSTFKNREFRVFCGSDIAYWLGLTLFQTGLPYFVTVLMGFDASVTTVLFVIMTLLSVACYPFVSKLVAKYGKKKLVVLGFCGLSVAYIVTALSGIGLPNIVYAIAICLLASFPMALLGIIPQSIVADVAEADAKITSENREGMFFAARTFAFKFGQSIALLLFTSIAIIGGNASAVTEDIPVGVPGLRICAICAAVLCALGAVILGFYNEKKINTIIAKEK